MRSEFVAQLPPLSSQRIKTKCGFQILRSCFLPFLYLPYLSFPRNGMLLFQNGKCWLDLLWQPNRQSNNNRGNYCTRNISRIQPSCLISSSPFWYKTRLLCFCYSFKTFLKRDSNIKTSFRVVNHNQNWTGSNTLSSSLLQDIRPLYKSVWIVQYNAELRLFLEVCHSKLYTRCFKNTQEFQNFCRACMILYLPCMSWYLSVLIKSPKKWQPNKTTESYE